MLTVVDVFGIMWSVNKNDFHSFVKYYFLRSKSANETNEKLDKYYGANAPSDYNVKYWFREFLGGRNSINDQVRSGRPTNAVAKNNVMHMKWCWLPGKWKFMISTERTRQILEKILHMKSYPAAIFMQAPKDINARAFLKKTLESSKIAGISVSS